MTQWIITSSVLIVIIAVLRFVLRGKISLKLQYALWGLVLIRLLLPFSIFESPASVLNLLQKREETVAPPAIYEPYEPETVTPVTPAVPDEDIFILDDNIEHIEPETNITVDDEGFVTEPEIRVISAKDILIPVWIGGIAVFGTVFAVSNLRFRKKLKNTREYLSETKAWLPVYKSSAVKTPCLFGAIKPAIYVTEEVLKDEKTVCHVLEHETTHYRHGDNVWSVLRCFCLALHWYNPLVWLAAFLSMRDSELACDEDTIKRIGEDERISYGRTLINLTCEKPAVGILSAATTMTGSKSSIKERILLIAKKPKMLWITAVLVALIAVFAVGCTFTSAVNYNPKTTDEPATETFSNEIKFDFPEITGKVRMIVTEASPKKITTEIFNETSEDIYYRISYNLHFEQNGKWYILQEINEENKEIDFGAKIIESGKSGVWENNIKEVYGKLPDGKYCINRIINYGEMDFSENEFYVIGTEFTLEDGKFVAEYPSELEKTEYIPTEQIFVNFASSFLGIPNEKYSIADKAFTVFDSETGEEIELIPVSKWKWQEFPYSAEEWKNLFIATETIPFPDISEYRSRYYQPLDDGKFIASLDGELWLVDLSHKKPGSEELLVWSIYEISQTETLENNKAYWECAPAMSSKLPWFEFEFDFDFSLINVGVYTTEGQGSLYDIHTGEDYNTLALKNGDFIRWVPYVGDSGPNFAQSATVNFVVYQNRDVYNYTHTGSLKIKQLASENGKTLYEATLISESLGLFQNEETGGAIICIKQDGNPFTEKESDSEPEIIADHIVALNHFLTGTYGAEFEEDKYGTFLFKEYPKYMSDIPDAVTFGKVTYGSEEKPTFNGYYLDPFERTVQPITNFSTKQELGDYIGKYLARSYFEYEYFFTEYFVELDGKLYGATGNIGNTGVYYSDYKIVSQTEDRIIASAQVSNMFGRTGEMAEVIFEKQNGNWIITAFGTVSNFEEKKAKQIYTSEIHSVYLEKINERIISYRDGTFEPMENHHSAYPADFPSLSKIESVGEECIVLAWKKTVDMGRIIYEGELDYVVVIDKTHAVILEPAEFIGDWGTSYGFANTGYIDAKKAGYQSIYDWIKDYYTGYYSGALVSSGLGITAKGTPLTENEVERVSHVFEGYRIDGGFAYPNLPAVFLQSNFERPEEINAAAFLYYFPSGMLITDEAEFEDLKKVWASYGREIREGTKIADHPVPLHKIPKSMVDEALEKYLGIGLEELRYSDLDSLAEGGIYYMEKYDCFYSEASDAPGGSLTCTSGEIYPDGTVVLYGEYVGVLVLKEHPDGSYKIYAYQR
ncbi:MAG: hypothetical protein IJ283_05835 [Oscillospiraceae bacterium]|nr:hypothetical protein [Oscillospiraceae bacterium]